MQVLKFFYFCRPISGDVAQLVEQRTENPCVSGSIPLITTTQPLPGKQVMKKDEKPVKFSKVLLIDDNDIDNFINERMITTSHFSEKVVVRNSAEGALEYLRQATGRQEALPEVIFLNQNIPVLEGVGVRE